MPELYLMRHAKAKRARGDMTDHQRPLRKRGRRQAAAMAQALQRWQAPEGEIHVSDAARTRETLDEIAGQLPELSLVERARFNKALYTFDGQALLAWLKALPDEADRVLVIGHNPALLELAHWLCGEAPQALPTGSLLHVTLPDTPWPALEQHCAELAASLTPEEASHALFKRNTPAPPDLNKAGLARRIRGLLEHQYLMVRALEPGVTAGVDPEFLHQYRVNLRRSRAIGESVLATTKVSGLKKRLKRLKRRAQATSELRDLDVFLESLAETPPPLSPRSHQALQRWLQACHRGQHEALCQQLSASDYAEEMQAWQGFIASGDFRKALRKLSSKRIEAVLAERIARHDGDLAALSCDSADAAFHELRKSMKRIRYLAELDPKRHRAFLSGLKRRQSLLGDVQDLCTRQAWIDAFSASSRNAPRRKQECAAWRSALEEQKQALRDEVMALAPLGA
ncbi:MULTISPECIES: CHAD domain-containing protein [unclassified Halomonas]|uniref:CHAD domain-containing protein n=1 Tax=unclassified Halomonas TaxID=2609666 RepID=UPI002468279F|nr:MULTISPECIES: CHAD domain-containing protein [unclassified Halomonas]